MYDDFGQRIKLHTYRDRTKNFVDTAEVTDDDGRHANRAFDPFVELDQAKYGGAVDCLSKDREQLLAFYNFPAAQWIYLRTTNTIARHDAWPP